MILQALEECYGIMTNDEKFDVAPVGYTKLLCAFVLVINEQGDLKGIMDLRDGKRGQPQIVPLQPGRSSGVKPYILCDKSKYLLGKEYNAKTKQLEQFKKHLEACIEVHKDFIEKTNDRYLHAVLNFLEKVKEGRALNIDEEHDIYKGSNIVFRIEGEKECIHQNANVKSLWEAYHKYSEEKADNQLRGQCLITGEENVPLASKHTLTKGVMGAQQAGASLAGVNLDSVESYGKKKSYNAPVSEQAMFRYTTALNSLLASNANHLIIGDTTCVFWTEKEVVGNCTQILMSLFTGEAIEKAEKEVQIASQETKQTKDILARVRRGLNITPEMLEMDKGTKVYILGLAPNMARLSVRFWYEDTFGKFVDKISQHYLDMEIVKGDKDKPIISTRDIIRAMAVQGKNENVPKTVENALFTAITSGTNYPQGVYTNILIRIRAETGEDFCINQTRAAFIKAYLKRKYRLNKWETKEEEITVALNESSTSTAYQLGRLFAVLEKIQADAGNKGLRERYFSSASTNPKVVFPAILKLSQSHIAKLSKEQGNVYLDKVCEDILSHIEAFPASLSLDDQGLFILGYYHQRKYIFTKKENR